MKVEGVKHVRPPTKNPTKTPAKTPTTAPTTHVKAVKATRALPFTGLPTRSAMMLAGSLVLGGTGLLLLGRRREEETA